MLRAWRSEPGLRCRKIFHPIAEVYYPCCSTPVLLTPSRFSFISCFSFHVWCWMFLDCHSLLFSLLTLKQTAKIKHSLKNVYVRSSLKLQGNEWHVNIYAWKINEMQKLKGREINVWWKGFNSPAGSMPLPRGRFCHNKVITSRYLSSQVLKISVMDAFSPLWPLSRAPLSL